MASTSNADFYRPGRGPTVLFREASGCRIERGDLVSFDTDLIGPAGSLADLSRTYLVGSSKASARQRRLYADAQAFLAEIIGELKPGIAFDEAGSD